MKYSWEPLNASHIIRTIEYWDIARRLQPQYDHIAVIVAEDITSRFLNVVGLFNGFIPIMAIQVTAIKTSEGVGLQFTKILDTVTLEDIEEYERTDRNYWEKHGTKETVALADKILEISKPFVSTVKFSYNKYYIGFWVDNRACNFAVCRPQKRALRLEIRLPQTKETDEIISNSGFEMLAYDRHWGMYRLTLSESDISEKKEILISLLKEAYKLRKQC